MTPDPPQAPASTPPKKRGCLFRALVGLAVLGVVLVVGGYLGYRYALQRILAGYTDTTPLDLGISPPSPSELGKLDSQLAAFLHALRNKRPIEPLVLTGDDLTALVSRESEFQRSGGRARFSITGGEIRGDLSIPLEKLGYPDRWFNGSAAFLATLENGVLIVTVQSAAIRGEPVPAWILERVRNQNLAKELYEDPTNAALISRLESIEVGEDRITVLPRIRQ